jgi:DNA-binding winged helix-turn-helix (wHTH) protein
MYGPRARYRFFVYSFWCEAGDIKDIDEDKAIARGNPASAISFASFHLDLRSGRLLRGAVPVPLRPKTWSVLRYLAERPGVLVGKDELLNAVWTGVAVTESVLSKSIGELRAALGDSFKAPRLIETVQRRGFRFIAETQAPDSAPLVAAFGNDEPEARDEQPGRGCFVGRATERRRLAGLFAKARGGERQVVFVTGPAGIGKTALVEAFLDAPAVREAEAPVWIARGLCVEQHGEREAYLPVLEALERLARRPDAGRLARLLRRVAPTWLAQVPWLIGHGDEQALRQSLQAVRPQRMLREFAALVEALTTDVTLVLVLEDLHWTDASTVDLLSMLAERRESARLLVIGTYRPAEAVVREHVLMSAIRALRARRRCVELALSDLTEEEVRSYLQARFTGSDFPPPLARLIYKHTDGHPLFVAAVVDHMLSRGDILDTAPGWDLPAPPEKIDLGLPDNVRLLIENQLDGLSPADRALLQAASVAGDPFTARVVAAALGCEEADAEMRCEAFAHAQRFLRVAGHVEWPDRSVSRRYGFTHELYRQVAYAEIPEARSIRLHQRIGQALEAAYGARQMEIAPELATHFERGRDDVRALRYLTAAAAGSRQRFANREAIAYLEAALALVALLPDEGEKRRRELELRLSLGAILGDVHGFASEHVRENYERASALCAAAGSAAQLFDVLHARWYFHAMHGDRSEATAMATELKSVARRVRTAGRRVLANSVLVRTAVYEGRYADAVHLARRRLARQRRPKRAATAVDYGPDPLIVAGSHSAIALWFLGHPVRAQTTANAAVERARKLGHSFTLCAVLTQAALVHLLCRNAAEGGDLAEQSQSLSAEHGFSFWNALASVERGWALVQQGRAPEGSDGIERALATMQAMGTLLPLSLAYAFLAEGRLRAGAPSEGLAAANAGLAATQAGLDFGYEPELWRLKGELVLASSAAAHHRPLPGKQRGKSATAADSHWQEAEHCLLRALELARAAHAKSLELRAATSLARAWRARGRAAEARTLLGGVCKWFGTRSGFADLVEARAMLTEPTTAR